MSITRGSISDDGVDASSYVRTIANIDQGLANDKDDQRSNAVYILQTTTTGQMNTNRTFQHSPKASRLHNKKSCGRTFPS